jgi:hypothetical protein
MTELPITPFPDLRYLLDVGEIRRTGIRQADGPNRSLVDVLREASEALQQAQLDFALAGALARSFYAPARATADIDFICLASQRAGVTNALQDAGFRVVHGELPYRLTFGDPRTSIEIDIHLGTVDPEVSAVSYPRRADFLGIPTLVVRPEYVLWRYCLSDFGTHRMDALDLLKSGLVDLNRLEQYLQRHAIPRRNGGYRFSDIANRETANGGYSASVVRRLQARSIRPIAVFRRQWSDDPS